MRKVICLWSNNGSTNPKTGVNERPEFCKKLKCEGIFKSIKEGKRKCDSFYVREIINGKK